MGAGTVTITVAVPATPLLVARTVLSNVPAVPPAVKTPEFALIVPPLFTTDQTGVMPIGLPLASLPTAVNCWFVLISTDAGFGVTMMVTTVGAGGVTMTVAVPEMAPLVARTVFVNVPAVVPAVNAPLPAIIAPPPATTDHVGVIATTLPIASLPTAVNVCAPPNARVAGFGLTTIVANAPAVTFTVAVAVMPPLVAC